MSFRLRERTAKLVIRREDGPPFGPLDSHLHRRRIQSLKTLKIQRLSCNYSLLLLVSKRRMEPQGNTS